MYNKIIDKIKSKNVCILGFGREGKSTYNFIRKYTDIKLTIIDKNNVFDNINDKNVNIIYGDNYLNNLEVYDLIIKTPGISLNDINIDKFKHKITSQLQLLLEVYKDNIIGITGTKGKSTTSTLIYKIIKDQGIDAYLLGNIGTPLFDEIEKYNKDTKLVIEMSALQLEYVTISPHIGIVLNLFEDHLDFFKTIEYYHKCKMNMFKYQTKDDYSIYSIDDINILKQISCNNYISKKYGATMLNNNKLDVIYKDDNKLILNNEVLYNLNNKRNLIGEHNIFNIMFSLVVSRLLDLNIEQVIKSINNFTPLEHRLELVGTYNGIIYYNDSISTIPQATINAIKTLKNVNTLIFGGMDRGINYEELVNFLNSSEIENLICMPTTGYKIAEKLKKLNTNKNIYCIEFLEDAVKKAKQVTSKGKICLMSPAASSYEYFKNFEEKGTLYKELVKK